MTSRYHEVYESWRKNPEGFWAGVASSEIDWTKPWDKVFDASLGVYGHWFPGAECNTCFNCVDRHAAKRPDATAIIYDSPVTNTIERISYAELLTDVQALAAVLQDHGVGKGDRVILYLPMIPAAAVVDARLRHGSARSIPSCSAASPRRSLRRASTTPSRS